MENSFEGLLVHLVERGVAFCTVGGLACALNGHVRHTEDVDILVGRDAANLLRLLQALGDIGAGYARELTPEDFTDEPGAIRVIEDFPIDIFVQLDGKHFEDYERNIAWHAVGDAKIPYLNAAALLAIKSGSLRPRDRLDALVLAEIVKGKR